jgi:hypothetical protein
MQRTVKSLLWFFAAICVLMRVANAAEQLSGSEPFEYAVPCLLLTLGAGFVGGALYFAMPDGSADCHNSEDSSTLAGEEAEAHPDAT